MGVEFEIIDGKNLASEASSVESLNKGFFGTPVEGKKNKLHLSPEEALFLMDVRNAEVTRSGKKIDFNQLAFEHRDEKKFLAKYFCYRDWRNRGLIVRSITEAQGN